MKENPDLVQCKCGNIMQVEQGRVDLNQKDADGKPIAKDAAECMSKFRVRCTQCQKNFCSNPNCMEEPYHEFKTCKQHKDYKEARKCRFCQTKLTHPSQSPIPAFASVCRKNECIELMNKSCDKVLPCGHACCGFKGE